MLRSSSYPDGNVKNSMHFRVTGFPKYLNFQVHFKRIKEIFIRINIYRTLFVNNVWNLLKIPNLRFIGAEHKNDEFKIN